MVACPGVSLVTDRLAARLGTHISRGSMSTLERYDLFHLPCQLAAVHVQAEAQPKYRIKKKSTI